MLPDFEELFSNTKSFEMDWLPFYLLTLPFVLLFVRSLFPSFFLLYKSCKKPRLDLLASSLSLIPTPVFFFHSSDKWTT